VELKEFRELAQKRDIDYRRILCEDGLSPVSDLEASALYVLDEPSLLKVGSSPAEAVIEYLLVPAR
jgi:hypothetical protein